MEIIIICFIVVSIILLIVLSYITYLYLTLNVTIHVEQQPIRPMNNYIERSPPTSYSDKNKGTR